MRTGREQTAMLRACASSDLFSYLVVTEDFCNSNNLKSQAARAIFFAQFQILVSNDIALKNAELESETCQYEKK